MVERIPIEEAKNRRDEIGKILVQAAEKIGLRCDISTNHEHLSFYHPDREKILVDVQIKTIGWKRPFGKEATVSGLMLSIDKDYTYFGHDGYRIGEKKFRENPDLVVIEVEKRLEHRHQSMEDHRAKGKKSDVAKAKILELKAKYPSLNGMVSLMSDKQDLTENPPTISIFAILSFDQIETIMKALSSPAPGGVGTEATPCGEPSRG